MDPARGVSALIRQFVFLALLGVAFLFLIGPAITLVALVFSAVFVVVAVVLPFALIGFLVWVPMRLVCHGPGTAWRDVRHIGRTFGGVAVVLPVHSCFQVCRRARMASQQVCEQARGISCRHGWTAIEMLCGGMVGGLVGVCVALQGQGFQPGVIVAGALLGCLLGYIVGRSRASRSQESVAG